MKKITLAALSARYSHSSLALLCLKHAAYDKAAVTTREYTINDAVMDVAADIVAGRPDAACFSCYIWNIEHVVRIASIVKAALPDCLIVLGGPEVSFDAGNPMRRWPFADVVIRGAGETPFYRLTKSLALGQSLDATPSACIRSQKGVILTPDAPPFELSAQPFLYGDLAAFENKMIYYETSRGCPFRCAYCMSAGEPLSFLPADRVKAELEYFLRAGVRQVKLVDRTFNHPDARAREIIEALLALKQKFPRSGTNFHFEVSASILSAETIALLAAAPKGLIQLEIGIQSTHGETLHAVSRAHDTQKLLANTAALCRVPNLRVYVDLIAGLPLDTCETFARSFDDAYRLGAARLHLGFLKLLRGSRMRRDAPKYGVAYAPHAPYEVLKTGTLSFDALQSLRRVALVLDALYNDGLARKTLELAVPAFHSPFAFFDGFTRHLNGAGYFARPQKKTALFEQLLAFAGGRLDETLLREALAYDWLRHGKPGEWPRGVGVTLLPPRDCAGLLRVSAHEAGRRFVLAEFTRLFGGPARLLFDYTKNRDDETFAVRV